MNLILLGISLFLIWCIFRYIAIDEQEREREINLKLSNVMTRLETAMFDEYPEKPKRNYSPCLFDDTECDHAIFCKAIIVNGVLEGCEYPHEKSKRKNSELAAIGGDDNPIATFEFDSPELPDGCQWVIK